MNESNISQSAVSDRTVRRFLNSKGYYYLQARKKGLMSKADKIKRVEFCKMIKKNYSKNFWRHGIAFYLDGASFPHKYNPASTAKAPKGRVWRKANEDLKQGRTAKGSKTGTGGRAVKVKQQFRTKKV